MRKQEVIDSIKDFSEKNIRKGSVIRTDNYRSYRKALQEAYLHQPKKFDIKAHPEHLKWLHRVIGNLKTCILGTYHGLGEKHLQAYLDEFCFRFNRRMFYEQGFNRLLNACMFSKPFTYKQLVFPVST